MLKPKITTRKFYNKWLYKVTISMPGVTLLRSNSLESIPFIDFEKKTFRYGHKNPIIKKEDIISLTNFLLKWDNNLWSKRIERQNLDIYTNNKEMFDCLLLELKNFIINSFEPDIRYLNVLKCTESIIVKKLPHDRYHYKAFLLPHKIKDQEEKKKYIEWIEQQGNKILITDTVKKWFVKTYWNWDRRYLFIEDEATLLMLKLRNSEVLGRIYDYYIYDK